MTKAQQAELERIVLEAQIRAQRAAVALEEVNVLISQAVTALTVNKEANGHA